MTTIPKIFLSSVIFATASLAAQAETQLHPIVTASRVAQSADQTLTAVTVINRDDIVHSQSQTVADLLRERVIGMDFLTAGGTGHQTSAFLRGTSSDQLLFIIDGNIVGSATTGAAAIELIPLQQIERIEIIRGPRSSLYGSDAIGGVIQVFTKAEGNHFNASVTYGSHNTQAATISNNVSEDNTQLNISVSHYETKGFNVANGTEKDNDGHHNDAANVSIKHRFGESSNIHASVIYAKGVTEFDNNSFDNVSDSIQQSYTLGFDTSSDNWSSSFDLGQSKDLLETDSYYEDFFAPGTFIFDPTLFETKRDQLRWQNSLLLGDSAQLSFGLDYINDRVESSTSFSEKERDNIGVYLMSQDKFGKHQLQLSARMDNNEAFGLHNTGNIAWSYDINGEEQFSLSHGTAFIAPTFNDLYFSSPFFNGNPNLDPEISRSTEMAFTGNHAWGEWETRAYHTVIKNLIVLNGSFSSVENADEAEINGLEFGVNFMKNEVDHQLSLSFVQPKDKGTGNLLQGRAKHTFKMNVSKNIDDYRIGANLLAQSSRFANSTNTVELGGYAVFNLMLEKAIDKNWTLKTRLDNVFNKEYSNSIDFYGNTTNNTPISLFVTLSYLN